MFRLFEVGRTMSLYCTFNFCYWLSFYWHIFLHQFCWSCSNPTFLTNATTTKFLNHIRYIFLNYMMSGVPAQFLYCAGFFFLWMFFFTWRDWTEFWKCYTDYKLMKSIVKKRSCVYQATLCTNCKKMVSHTYLIQCNHDISLRSAI